MSEFIKRMAAAFRDAGIEVPTEIELQVDIALRREMGGCDVYVPSLPKAQHNRIERAGRTQQQRANELGISVRQLRRIERGR